MRFFFKGKMLHMQFYRPLSDYVEKYDACLIGGKKNDVSPGRRKSAKKSSELEILL